MRRPFYFILILVVLAWAVWFLVVPSQGDRPAFNPEPPAAAEVAKPAVSEAARVKERAGYENQTKNWIGKMEKLEERKQARVRAEAKTADTRGWLQRDRRDAWTALLTTNREAFQALLDKARRAPNGQTACTICDGRGSLAFCILCSHHNGKCPTCNGSGQLSVVETCPTCLGSGKCYLCRGSGRMSCPFCNDGLIFAGAPQPPQAMPMR